MTRTFEPGEDQPAVAATGPEAAEPIVLPASGGDGTVWADSPGDLLAETADLIAQIRQLAAHDPAGVQQVVADVLNALDGAAGGELSRSAEASLADSASDS